MAASPNKHTTTTMKAIFDRLEMLVLIPDSYRCDSLSRLPICHDGRQQRFRAPEPTQLYREPIATDSCKPSVEQSFFFDYQR